LSHRPFNRVGVVFNASKDPRRVDAFVRGARARLDGSERDTALYGCRDGADVAIQARRAVDDGCDLVVAAGGDGTVLGILRGMAGSGAALAALPLGTANDFASSLGVGNDRRALAALASGHVRAVDLIACQYQDREGKHKQDLICSSAGLGFTAELTRMEATPEMQTLKRRFGSFAFVLASAKLLLTYTGAWLRVSLDGREQRLRGSLVELGKIARVGGLPLLPRARLDSGTLDLCVFDSSTLRAAQLLLTVQFSQRHLGWPDYHYLTGARTIELTPEEPLPLHLHGEHVGRGAVRFEVRPGALRVLALAPAR
jgi:diacylglycerol kinase (ATP)